MQVHLAHPVTSNSDDDDDKNNLTVNPDKTNLCHTEISFLCNFISHNQIKIDPDRTKALMQCKKPNTKMEIARYIGMISYLSKFIPNFSVIAAPINELRKKKSKFKWTQQCETAFQKLKEIVGLCNPPVLAIPNLNAEFLLFTDASEIGCGSVLMQKDDEGNNRPCKVIFPKSLQNQKDVCLYIKKRHSQ